MRNKYSKKYFLLLIFGLKAASFTFVTKQVLLMLQKFSGILFLMSCSFLFAQQIPKTDNICFFQDGKTGKPITIVNDSLVYKGELKNPSRLKHTDYPDPLERYKYHFIINKHTYLVHDGCGPVLEYRNDSIVRIDNSFLQKNQFGASPFIYNNQICLFGGYGLFITKNIITRFDFKTKEWFRLYNNGFNKPNERSESIFFYNTKGLYVFGGQNNNNSIDNSCLEDQKLWYLNYSNLEWTCKGNYNKLLNNLKPQYTFQDKTKFYIITAEKIIEIDFIKNKVSWYKIDNLIAYNKISYDPKTKSLYYLANLSGEVKLMLEKITLSELLKKQINSEKLYYSPWEDYIFKSIWAVLVILIIYGLYTWKLQQKGKCFIYHESKNKFYYKSKIILNLEPLEEKILINLFKNNKTFIQLNQLNSIFEKESPENYTNIIKKRDLVLSTLLVKLNAYTTKGEKPLVLIQKNEVDKRIKEIKLNPLYFNIK